MERLKFRQQVERLLRRLDAGHLDFVFERETLLRPAVLKFYDKDSNLIKIIENPTGDKVREALKEEQLLPKQN